MRAMLIAAAAALALAGCQTTSLDQSIQKSLPQLCSAAETAHAGFLTAAAFGVVSDRTMAREAAAWDALEPLCETPGTATSADVLLAAARAYAVIAEALRQAEAG